MLTWQCRPLRGLFPQFRGLLTGAPGAVLRRPGGTGAGVLPAGGAASPGGNYGHDHRLAGWGLWLARPAGSGAVVGAVAICGHRAHGVYRRGATAPAGSAGWPWPRPTGGAVSLPGAVAGAGACLPGQLPGVDGSGP